MFSAAGTTALFLFISIAVLLFSIYLLIYAAHCFLTVFAGTAAGGDDIGWPGDIVIDWIWKALYLCWLFLVGVVPSFLLSLAFGTSVFPDLGPGLTALFIVGLAWLLYPIILMSSQSSDGPWFSVLRWEILRRLGYQLPAYVAVLLLTTGLMTAWVALAMYSIYGGALWLLLLAAPAGAAMLLINARLLGRLAWLVATHTPDPPDRARKKKKKQLRPAGVALEAHDPWEAADVEVPADAIQDFDRPAPPPEPEREASPEELEDEWGPPKPYGLSNKPPTAPPPKKAGPRPIDALPPDEVYGFLPEEKPAEPAPLPADGYTAAGTRLPPAPPREEEPANNCGTDFVQQRLVKGRDNLKPPRFALFSGVYSFPWYPDSLRPWIYLTLFGLVLGFLLHWQYLMWPFGND